jgi:predicted PilT family ATPase
MNENGSLREALARSLAPAIVDEVLLFPWIDKAVAIVPEDQIAAAIGRSGENAKQASELNSISIEVMTRKDLESQIEEARTQFSLQLGATPQAVDTLIEKGVIYLDDVAIMDEEELARAVDIEVATARHWVAIADQATRDT